jgi:hypothetical protein
MLRPGNVAASRDSSRRLGARRGPVALLLLAALAPATAVGQRAPQPVFTELFAYDPAVPSQLLGKWLISSQLDSKLQPLRVANRLHAPHRLRVFDRSGRSLTERVANLVYMLIVQNGE